MTVQCSCCFREERWEGDVHEEITPGGARRPGEHPVLAAWRVIRAARSRGASVVAACPKCGQPMVTGEAVPAIPWSLALAEGAITVGPTGFSGPEGPLEEEDVTARLEALYTARIPFQPGLFLFRTVLLGSMAVPVLLWLAGMYAVWLFLTHYYR